MCSDLRFEYAYPEGKISIPEVDALECLTHALFGSKCAEEEMLYFVVSPGGPRIKGKVSN